MGLRTILKKMKRKEKEVRILILFRLNMWDVGGQKSLRAYWRNYFESTDGLIWVVDSADRRRLTDCYHELRTLLCEEKLLGSSLLVLANKQDLPGALPPQEIGQVLELSEISSLHWKLVGCSAISGVNGLLDGMDWLLDDLSRRLFLVD
ncbi:hypothetical protein HPB48_006005 [Haemaphysalis longicornis]|uniref:ADP-ribosylation factor-like protein 2 n=1 Tax=Haemaphysalis longicornis TaxID=44386 RepID=A0A9J6FB09_HAELO|nr:hypothetical protein HPB48_006005 [Haemaphysalis longicornis]